MGVIKQYGKRYFQKGGLIVGAGPIRTMKNLALAANGTVVFDASTGDSITVALSANATSSSIINPSTGQELTIGWIQTVANSTYVWPTNCKFAAGTAPAASTTVNYVDLVKFVYDGTYWREVSRSLGTH